jgi:hypothetical protein
MKTRANAKASEHDTMDIFKPVRECVERHKAARVDASGRVLCDLCAGTDPKCVACDGTGFMDDIGTVDREDVRQ